VTDVNRYVAAEAEFERIALDARSWVDVARGWLRDPDEVYERLVAEVEWRTSRLWRYERWVEEPRVGHGYGRVEDYPHRALVEAQRALSRRYRVPFGGVGLNYYRDRNDSVAFHRDRDMRHLDDTIVAILTLGARRPFLLRPHGRRDRFLADHNGATHDLSPGSGDLLVLGGALQAGWNHGVPKVPYRVGGRISAMWRWTSGRGRPEVGPSYRAPRHFTRR
jgi:alkylated DNA repair dioxygenase AlkB